MSADNWAYCPKCKVKEEKAAQEFSKRVEESYGKIPVDEYLKMREQDVEPIFEDTLREDYEIGIWEDIFEISYNCSCNVCGYSFEYEHKQQLP